MTYQRLSAEDAITLIEQGAKILDIRDPVSFENGHVTRAIHLQQESLDQFMQSTASDETLIVCCYHGLSSQTAADFLIKHGYQKVYSLDGGFEGFKQSHPDWCET